MRYSKVCLAKLASLVMLACSSNKQDETPAPAPPPTGETPPGDDSGGGGDVPTDDGGVASPVADGGSKDAGPKPPTNQAECIAACEVQFPKAAATAKKVDQCFVAGACEPVCNNLGNAKEFFEPDLAADGTMVCDTKKASSDPIVTGSKDCSNCIAGNVECCGLWTSIFGSIDGRGLSMCANACYTKFKN